MISCFINDRAYCVINAGNKIELYHVKTPAEKHLINTFPINEDLTYFAISPEGIFINKYICNPVTGSIAPFKGPFPKTPYHTEKIKVTFRSKLAVLADYTFAGKPFEDIALNNVPLDVNYKINNLTVSETFWGTKFRGNSDAFISEVLGGLLTRLDLIDCWRDHVYREYDFSIASCETCNITKFAGLDLYRSSCIKPTTRIVVAINSMHILFGREKDDSQVLMFKDGKLYKTYLGYNSYIFGSEFLHISGKYKTLTEYS